jgi:patatin-like phospholipase/acyl hydrolase
MSLPFKKLALGGGGTKGILHVGALRELQKHQPLQFPEGIYGCSVGSIMATYLSFNLPVDDRFVELSTKHISMDKLLPKLTFNDISAAFSSKGMFAMDVFEKAVVNLFLEYSIDLRNTKIGDTHQPLFIVASNITKGVPTIFTKDVPILDALKCSCCLPGIFKPQSLYNQLYIDGGVFVPCMSWIQPDALILSLPKLVIRKITPENVNSTSILDFMRDIHSMSVKHSIEIHSKGNIIQLSYPGLLSDSDLADFHIEDILEHSEKLMRRFLVSKSLL